MYPKTIANSIYKNGSMFTYYAIELENAVLCLFFEGDERKIGTLAVATPKIHVTAGMSSILMGYRNANLSRILAEHLASKFNKIAIVSVFIYSENDIHKDKALLELTKSIIGVNP